MELKLKSCLLRPWRKEDQDSLVLHGNDKDVSRNLTDRYPYPYTEKDASEWLELCVNADRQTNFAIDVDGLAVGGIGLKLKDDIWHRSVEIGYWLGQTFWGRGIMSEAITAVTDYAFDNFDICRVDAWVFDWNAPSMHILEKCGYQREGQLRKAGTKDGKVFDIIVYSLVR